MDIALTPTCAAGPPVEDLARSWLADICDLLIPAGSACGREMPSASAMGVAKGQLDIVARARPDLMRHLVRAATLTEGMSPESALEELNASDPVAYQSVCLVVAGGYYTHSTVRSLLGYTGQEPKPVRVDQLPEYIEEGLLERVIERGGRFRHV
ncbi:hypothetical protein [Rhodococcus sp. NPDC057529]|uniref:hypothetical protein n=1 Tax=Rhodococcus sp. NPDC057529 TaxID=3346158 RepID=UPI00366C98F7